MNNQYIKHYFDFLLVLSVSFVDWEGEYAMIPNEPYLELKDEVSNSLSLNHNLKRS